MPEASLERSARRPCTSVARVARLSIWLLHLIKKIRWPIGWRGPRGRAWAHGGARGSGPSATKSACPTSEGCRTLIRHRGNSRSPLQEVGELSDDRGVQPRSARARGRAQVHTCAARSKSAGVALWMRWSRATRMRSPSVIQPGVSRASRTKVAFSVVCPEISSGEQVVRLANPACTP